MKKPIKVPANNDKIPQMNNDTISMSFIAENLRYNSVAIIAGITKNATWGLMTKQAIDSMKKPRITEADIIRPRRNNIDIVRFIRF
jgi:hypothetical protein